MPLQNRVTPLGDLVAVAGRGLLMGNRGVLHDDARRIVRPWQLRPAKRKKSARKLDQLLERARERAGIRGRHGADDARACLLEHRDDAIVFRIGVARVAHREHDAVARGAVVVESNTNVRATTTLHC
jgi:ribosomal protein S4